MISLCKGNIYRQTVQHKKKKKILKLSHQASACSQKEGNTSDLAMQASCGGSFPRQSDICSVISLHVGISTTISEMHDEHRHAAVWASHSILQQSGSVCENDGMCGLHVAVPANSSAADRLTELLVFIMWAVVGVVRCPLDEFGLEKKRSVS